MTGLELLEKEFNTLKEDFKELKKEVELLIKERDEARAAEARALEENLKMWAYYQEEEYKARQAELESEGCRNAE